jgi:hypothetical protein
MKFEEPICVVFSATEWVKGKQMEEVMTIKNTLVFFFLKRFYLFLLHYLSFICVVLDRKSNDFARL